ncbi:MAG: glycosyltransferase [gamma proteobacterium symbiont of Taylorina sp.]|nr:glycosyltransferase [gamma proteobacterium symbiont of Taylorina sp.]
MKIAIIAPSPVPFTIGGAEKLWWGLLDAINQQGEHQAELIKIPSPERQFSELISSYRHFSELDLLHFDQVISTKYPAWMVDHPNHHCYMQHKLRGLYDTYHFSGLSCSIDELQDYSCPELKQLYQLLNDKNKSREQLIPFWELWQQLNDLIKQQQLPPQIFAFPGSLSRAIIHFLDDVALQPGKIKRFCAISENITHRQDYFPAHTAVQVIHHPSDLRGFKNQSQNKDLMTDPYIFTISRLDAPKRIDLLIKAFIRVPADIRFRIAGEGPMKKQLQQLAQSDPRIELIGRISDQQVIEEYAGALFIPFIPYDEDYGLITIEAMKSQKAVLTTIDAGGVNEFVENGITGYSVAADEISLARAMKQLIEVPEETINMGKNALQKVQPVNWKNTIRQLLNSNTKNHQKLQKNKENNNRLNEKRLNIIVALSFACWPPQGGGQSRIYYLYREIAKYHNVTLLALVDAQRIAGEPWQDRQIAPGLREICIAKTRMHLHYQQKLKKQLKLSIDDIACIEGHRFTPQYAQAIKVFANDADLFIASHPYLYDAVKQNWQGRVWYEAHNVEVDLKQGMLGQTSAAGLWLTKVHDIEQAACQAAEIIMTCSQTDAQRLAKLYRQPMDKMLVVANGVAMQDDILITTPPIHKASQFSCLFMGSWHGPNIEAVEQIKAIAEQTADVQFLIMGSVCKHPVCENRPDNCHLLGVVSETEKNLYQQTADIAINPMLSGSGTNLKMLDYTANSLPVLTTEFGLRGLEFIKDQEILIAPIDKFAEQINHLQQNREQTEQLQKMAVKARQKTAKLYQWQSIAQVMLEKLEKEV